MRLATVVLLIIVCILGIATLTMVYQDKPEYADGEPTAIVQDWLRNSQEAAASTSPGTPATEEIPGNTDRKPADEDRGEVIWKEEYLGEGKWLVSKAALPSDYSETELTFNEWISQTKGWDVTRLQEYSSDLSPEDQEAFQEHLRTYNPGQQAVDILEEWHVYEHTGLVEEVHDE